ncbi:hypothetical protein A0H81_02969 [Grifola frondosa]|uniref:Uncharacterized protein n=1 Tax=Grifola frondosa TaxID=5627 RepID=A0A1C7MIW6_GRIFR|nr:hypothetical protein A0H81_02969 [Grifola frondosa]
MRSECPLRIWWCSTGPLAFHAIHAAGPIEEGKRDLPELVVSSYMPTLHCFFPSLRIVLCILPYLAAGQPGAPELLDLQAVLKEMNTIRKLCARRRRSCHPEGLTRAARAHLAVSRAMHISVGTILSTARSFCTMGSRSSCSCGDASLPDKCIHLAAGM